MLLTKTTFDEKLKKEIEKNPNRFFTIVPARADGEIQMIRGENITMITPLTDEQLQAKLDKIDAGKKEAEVAAAAEAAERKIIRPGFRIPAKQH